MRRHKGGPVKKSKLTRRVTQHSNFQDQKGETENTGRSRIGQVKLGLALRRA